MENLRVIKGDITRLQVDAIVNAANSSLLGGGGVDGAIHRAAGPLLLEECKKAGGCPTGEARITGAYELPARFVIHTVGPVWSGGTKGEPGLLKNCYLSSLKLAAENNLRSIAFPCISTGVYGYPREEAASIAVSSVAEYINQNDENPNVIFVTFDDETFDIYSGLLDGLQNK